MSFILDALKKSESERQRQSGPALFEVKIAPPRSRFAVWGAAIAALLVINFFVVGFWLWRGSASRAAPSAPAEQTGAISAAPAAVSAGARDGVRPESAGAPGAAAVPTAALPASSNTVAARASAGSSAPASRGAAPAAAADAGANPDDLAPAVEPRGSASQPTTPVTHATESGLPTYQDAAAEPGAEIPSLRLDLHVYSPQPDQRFVFLNMLKLREGDTTPQGVRVERITEDGVILSYRGKEFVLQRQ
ncbi:MAG: general secretion pathway protein GspB [Steroidobacteraceae bacterium]